MATPAVVDAHHHLWPASAVPEQGWQPPGASALRRGYEPADLLPELARSGVARTVLMQSVDGPAENDRLGAYAAAADVVAGVVAWAPLDRPSEADAVLDDLLGRRSAGMPVVGLRFLAGADPMGALLTTPALAVLHRLAQEGLAWDVVPVTPAQRDVVARVAGAVPDLRVVVDHLAAPPLDTADEDAWHAALRDLAAHPNVAVKLSVGVAVLTRWERWETSRVTAWVGRALDAFGPDRSMAASNWPVVLLRAPYARAWADVRDAAVSGLSPAEVGDVLGGTAQRWYGLTEGRRG